MDVKAIIVHTARQAFEPLETKNDVDKVTEYVGDFVDQLNRIYKYVVRYGCTAKLTLEAIENLCRFDTEIFVWRSLDRQHNVRLVEAEIRRFLTMLNDKS
ncbi:MAG: hypothetical protein QNJ41_17960 [Xenococcaceae cyanobacterium MO_188.B32]|nr:hypothetical protein [Xenococcaceae cyanobacterium MO_188.B32]